MWKTNGLKLAPNHEGLLVSYDKVQIVFVIVYKVDFFPFNLNFHPFASFLACSNDKYELIFHVFGWSCYNLSSLFIFGSSI